MCLNQMKKETKRKKIVKEYWRKKEKKTETEPQLSLFMIDNYVLDLTDAMKHFAMSCKNESPGYAFITMYSV